MTVRILNASVLDGLAQLPAESVRCVVTSPPYWGLRNYGVPGQLGLELRHDCLGWATQQPCGECYVCHLVEVFRAVRRVLAKDGTVWLNLGDSYAQSGRGGVGDKSTLEGGQHNQNESRAEFVARPKLAAGLKSKDLVGIPWRVAFALQADGWYLRQDNVWAKPNPMPESVRDRTTRAHEFVFTLAKSERYYYDYAAIKTPAKASTLQRIQQATFDEQSGGPKDYAKTGQNANRSTRKTLENYAAKLDKQRGHSRRHAGFNDRWDKATKDEQAALGANKRSVWWVATKGYKGAHFAVFPEALVEPCILAGSATGDAVLDPFGGSGTTAVVAAKHGRNSILIELNPEYCAIALQRTENA